MKHRKAKKRLDARRAAASAVGKNKNENGFKRPGSMNRHKSFPVK
jgi:hypothetical protein